MLVEHNQFLKSTCGDLVRTVLVSRHSGQHLLWSCLNHRYGMEIHELRQVIDAFTRVGVSPGMF